MQAITKNDDHSPCLDQCAVSFEEKPEKKKTKEKSSFSMPYQTFLTKA